jgi:hypothetical protein
VTGSGLPVEGLRHPGHRDHGGGAGVVGQPDRRG